MGRRYSAIGQCLGKRSYWTKAEAKAVVRLHLQRHDQVKAYRCPHCGRFHVGHSPPETPYDKGLDNPSGIA